MKAGWISFDAQGLERKKKGVSLGLLTPLSCKEYSHGSATKMGLLCCYSSLWFDCANHEIGRTQSAFDPDPGAARIVTDFFSCD